MRLFIFILFSSTLVFADNLIVTAPGHSVSFQVPQRGALLLSNGKLVSIKDRGSHLMITGKKIGTTQLSAGIRTYSIHVLPYESFLSYEKTRRLLTDRMGLELGVRNGKVVLTGRLLRWKDWLDLSRIHSTDSELRFGFAAEITEDQRRHFVNHIQKLLSRSQVLMPQFRFENGVSAQIPEADSKILEIYKKVLSPFGVEVELHHRMISLEPMVHVQIVVMELRRASFSKFGIEWPGSYTAQLLPNTDFSEKLSLALHTLEERGLGRILASPTILCRSGKESDFLAGGEFPLKVVGRKSNAVVWKQYGVVLKVKPLVDLSGRMSISLQTEVSMIDSSQVVDGVPGLFTNRIQSHFDLARSETIALSGLIKREWGEAQQGLPGLSRIPILGSLFSSRDYREASTELVIFVTPKVVQAEDPKPKPKTPQGW